VLALVDQSADGGFNFLERHGGHRGRRAPLQQFRQRRRTPQRRRAAARLKADLGGHAALPTHPQPERIAAHGIFHRRAYRRRRQRARVAWILKMVQ